MDESPNASAGELSERELSEALTEADIPILLLVLSQLTGDSRWLEAPFSPKEISVSLRRRGWSTRRATSAGQGGSVASSWWCTQIRIVIT